MEHFSIITTREYLNKIGNKSFIIMTLLLPIILAGITFLLSFLTSINNDSSKTISVVDNTGYIYQKLESSDDIIYDLIVDSSLDEAKEISRNNSDYGLLYITDFDTPEEIAESIVFISEDSPSLTIISRVESQLETILTNENFRLIGIDVNEINSSTIYINLFQESFDGEETTRVDGVVKLIFGFFLGFLLYFFIFAYGSMIMMSVMEEKTNRIIEIIISSVKPFHLMTGKIIGVSLAALTQVLIWGVMFFVFSYIFSLVFGISTSYNTGDLILSTEGDTGLSSFALEMITAFMNLPLTNIFIAFIMYFLGGYFLYASIFAAIGAAIDNQADAQQFMMPITLLVIIALYVGILTVPEDPNGIVAQIFSYFPFTSPIVMLMRIPNGVPIYEQIISLTILFSSVVFMIWIAAKVYRIGILMYGKKLTYGEIIKWLRS
ncbi:ABC transporter permease [Flavobacteriaceae bacterium]|jgi:ABC-2 type transport system permease protein|nr:ABC transporter permease [Flavobacteriaceae bacterium]MDC6461707.1 ABC transporter permease [Flavobacteriaceae bacterium]|tara:strand:- start:32 stop:1336 length:1305 start_codon:yes stop_codon:yes gene_type:complete